jgi:nucleoside-diphosphate kinase
MAPVISKELKTMLERTLAIIKPDAVKKNAIGKIIQRIEDEGFRITAMKMVSLSKDDAKGFYIVHKARPFYESLTEFMSSGPAVVMALEREDAIAKWREVMGATDPARARPGTLRHALGFSIERNAVHGSDARETAEWELGYFFKK